MAKSHRFGEIDCDHSGAITPQHQHRLSNHDERAIHNADQCLEQVGSRMSHPLSGIAQTPNGIGFAGWVG
jgi:hypothetical protein